MKLHGRSTDAWGNVIFDSDGLIAHLMKGNDLTHDMVANATPGVIKYNDRCREFDHPDDQIHIYTPPTQSVADWDAEHQSQWFIPEPYAGLDVQEWLLMKCQTEQAISRVLEELELFKARDMISVLRCLIYLIAHFREEEIVWGVGRGSSVASYCLFLIGVHKIDSLKYDLDVSEFLK